MQLQNLHEPHYLLQLLMVLKMEVSHHFELVGYDIIIEKSLFFIFPCSIFSLLSNNLTGSLPTIIFPIRIWQFSFFLKHLFILIYEEGINELCIQ